MTQPRPLAICLEDLAAPAEATRFLTCVAIPGRAPGLTIADSGAVRWQVELGAECELWVSADDRLILYRRSGAGPVGVRRGPRALDVPAEKPVVLVDQDEVEVAGRLLRVHVHGEAPEVRPPAYLVPERAAPASGLLARAAATAIAFGAAVGGAACGKGEAAEPPPVEVRTRPPDIGPPPRKDAGVRRAPDAAARTDDPRATVPPPPIEVRQRPPEAPALPRDAGVKRPPRLPDAGRR
jgi:hypothetical protein